MKNTLCLLIAVFSLLLLASCSSEKNTENIELTISAAASLSDAMEVIQNLYNEDSPEITLNFNFGSSGSLQQQISQGAPADLFFSAAEDKFDLLIEEGRIAAEDGVDLLGNSIVLVVPNDADSEISSFEDLANEEVERISIGTPETVPAGAYGKEALENLDLWQDVESKIVYAKDVRQVLSYVETGNVAAGIVYKTDAAISDNVTIIQEAGQNTHTPIIYPVGIIKDAPNAESANDFYQFLQTDAALEVFEEYGFTVQ